MKRSLVLFLSMLLLIPAQLTIAAQNSAQPAETQKKEEKKSGWSWGTMAAGALAITLISYLGYEGYQAAQEQQQTANKIDIRDKEIKSCKALVEIYNNDPSIRQQGLKVQKAVRINMKDTIQKLGITNDSDLLDIDFYSRSLTSIDSQLIYFSKLSRVLTNLIGQYGTEDSKKRMDRDLRKIIEGSQGKQAPGVDVDAESIQDANLPAQIQLAKKLLALAYKYEVLPHYQNNIVSKIDPVMRQYDVPTTDREGRRINILNLNLIEKNSDEQFKMNYFITLNTQLLKVLQYNAWDEAASAVKSTMPGTVSAEKKLALIKLPQDEREIKDLKRKMDDWFYVYGHQKEKAMLNSEGVDILNIDAVAKKVDRMLFDEYLTAMVYYSGDIEKLYE